MSTKFVVLGDSAICEEDELEATIVGLLQEGENVIDHVERQDYSQKHAKQELEEIYKKHE